MEICHVFIPPCTGRKNKLTLFSKTYCQDRVNHSVEFCDGFIPPCQIISCIARAAKRVGIWELDSSIAKDLIDSENPKHTLFCREIAFVSIYGMIFPSFDSNLNRFVNHYNIFAINRIYFSLIKQICYR